MNEWLRTDSGVSSEEIDAAILEMRSLTPGQYDAVLEHAFLARRLH